MLSGERSLPIELLVFITQLNIRCGYSKEPSQIDGSFEHPKEMFALMGKKIRTILCFKGFLIGINEKFHICTFHAAVHF